MMTWSRDILKEHNIVAVAFGPDVTVDEEVISSFDSNMWYSTVTFMALREVMEIPINWILVLSFEELPSRYPITQLITDIAYVIRRKAGTLDSGSRFSRQMGSDIL